MTINTLIQMLQAAVTASFKTGNAEVLVDGEDDILGVVVLDNGNVSIVTELDEGNDESPMDTEDIVLGDDVTGEDTPTGGILSGLR